MLSLDPIYYMYLFLLGIFIFCLLPPEGRRPAMFSFSLRAVSAKDIRDLFMVGSFEGFLNL